MGRRTNTEDLTIEELRRLLVEKKRASRQERLERFRRTGRVVSLAPDIESHSLEDLRSGELQESDGDPGRATQRKSPKRIIDGLLLGIEMLAVAGLIFIIYNGVTVLRELNQEVAVALEPPTLSPTPLISAIVLPSGHTPPNSPQGAQPNEAEIPEHLRPLVQSMVEIPIPTPGPQHAIRIQIPAINVDAPVIQGDGWEQLKKGVGQHLGTANPGERGNIVLSAHNDIFGEIFRELDKLKPGDAIILYTPQKTYTYTVTGSKIVEPTQVEVMDATAQPTATLISCYPYLVDNKRIVVVARLRTESN